MRNPRQFLNSLEKSLGYFRETGKTPPFDPADQSPEGRGRTEAADIILNAFSDYDPERDEPISFSVVEPQSKR